MTSATDVVVIGIGNPMRHDDGIGHSALDQFAANGEHLEVRRLDGEPTRLIDAWRDRGLVIVIDAVDAGIVPGDIVRVEVGVDPLPCWSSTASSHRAGLAEAIDLARVLDSLPDRLVIFGVQPADLSMGEGLSPDVLAAMPTLIDRVRAETA